MELKKFLRQSTFAIALSVPVLITGCDKDDDPVNNTITDVVVGNASFTTLEAAVVKTLVPTLLVLLGKKRNPIMRCSRKLQNNLLKPLPAAYRRHPYILQLMQKLIKRVMINWKM